jgi:hypothetical protein
MLRKLSINEQYSVRLMSLRELQSATGEELRLRRMLLSFVLEGRSKVNYATDSKGFLCNQKLCQARWSC